MKPESKILINALIMKPELKSERETKIYEQIRGLIDEADIFEQNSILLCLSLSILENRKGMLEKINSERDSFAKSIDALVEGLANVR